MSRDAELILRLWREGRLVGDLHHLLSKEGVLDVLLQENQPLLQEQPSSANLQSSRHLQENRSEKQVNGGQVQDLKVSLKNTLVFNPLK